MSIQVKNIQKQFGDFTALNNVSLDFNSGELVALLGPSGCGKTTLLRIIAGLEQADSGTVILDGEDTSGTHVRDRNVGFVFQHYALFKHMTVFDNVAFGMRMKPRSERPSKAEIAEKVHSQSPKCCCWMSLSVHLMPRCARNFAAGYAVCMMNCTSPRFL